METLLAEVAFGAAAVIGFIQKKVAVALASVGLFLLGLSEAAKQF